MRDLSDLKIGIIGMGRLMETIRPCYAALLETPERLRANVVATTLDEKDLEDKNRRLGFKVQLGDNPGMLRKLRPDLILFAPPPKAALGLAEEVLAPYAGYCEEKGLDMPTVFAFPPSPGPKEYSSILPAGMKLAVTVPCLGAGGGFVLASLRRDGDEDTKDLVERFFSPMAPVEFLPPEGIPAYLGSACLYPPAGHVAYDISLVCGWDEELIGAAAEGWMEGIAAYRKSAGIAGTEAEIEEQTHNYINEAKTGGWKAIQEQDERDCTPGGIAERVLIEYNSVVKDAIGRLLSDTPREELGGALKRFAKAEAVRISDIAMKKAATLHV